MDTKYCLVVLAALISLEAPSAALAGRPELLWDRPQTKKAKDLEKRVRQESKLLGKLEQARELRVLWWNIEFNQTSARIARGECPSFRHPDALGTNLERLTAPDSGLAPDVVALGEYRESKLPAAALAALKSRYPHQFFVPYTPQHTLGVAVFSRIPLALQPPIQLDWVEGKTSAEREKNRSAWLAKNRVPTGATAAFARPYLRFRGQWGGKPVSLVVEHLVAPWNLIVQGAQKRARWLKRLWGKAVGAFQVFAGRNTPLYNQAEYLLEAMRADLGPKLDREPVLLIGDLNQPPGSAVDRMLSRPLKDAYGLTPGRVSTVGYTFPTRCSLSHGKYPKTRIDQAYERGFKTLFAGILELHGGDHYPIYVVLKPDAKR